MQSNTLFSLWTPIDCSIRLWGCTTSRLSSWSLSMHRRYCLISRIKTHNKFTLFVQDPREYLPFLRELRSLDQHYQRFRIDDHLKRYQKALSSLYEAGQRTVMTNFSALVSDGVSIGLDRFDEAMAYVEKHRLYEHALALWQGSDNYDVKSLTHLRGCMTDSTLQLVCAKHIRRMAVRSSRIPRSRIWSAL